MQRKSGLLVIHMGTPRELLAYNYGDISAGFARLRYVIESASK
jgi:hypothetical protein